MNTKNEESGMGRTREILVVGAARTAVGTFGGSLKGLPPVDLATLVIRHALIRSGTPAEAVGHVVMGNVVPTEARDAYLSRVAAIQAGIPRGAPAFNVNRLCGSGLQAIVSAAQSLLLGDADLAVGGGVESMSRAPYIAAASRWGARLGDAALSDTLLGVLHDPFERIHMGMTAENVAAKFGITRESMDALAVESHRRAARALENGYFREQTVPVEMPARKGMVTFASDEHVRPGTTMADLARMAPAFMKEGGTVTAGNASGLNDGAATVVLATEEVVNRYDLRPLARLVAYAHAGVDPNIMGIGPVPATRLALKRSGLRVEDLDVIECNEAFAAQACAVMQELDLDPEKVNPNGSGISLGHPLGATGAIITTKLLYELQRTKGRYGLATMCIGGGQGIAAIFERWW
jgi:acetyl-CoA C-acetyltransferase